MHINKYLTHYERLYNRCKRCVYLLEAAEARVESPPTQILSGSAATSKRGSYIETTVIKLDELRKKYRRAASEFDDFQREFKEMLRALSEQNAVYAAGIRLVYMTNVHKELPPEKRTTGLCRTFGTRFKVEALEDLEDAKRDFAEILKSRGVDVEI